MPSAAQAPDQKASVVVLTSDSDFANLARQTFGSHDRISLQIPDAGLAGGAETVGATVVVADIGAGGQPEILALQRLIAQLGGESPIVVVMQEFGETIARYLLQARITDFLVKPVQALDFVRACGRAIQRPAEERTKEAEIHTFLPGAGGVGVTTLAIQTAMLLRGTQRGPASTCLVDLNLQQGACADYLDIEPRLDLGEIEPRPERLDHHLLEVMISHHASGLAVIAAPNRPTEMRSFDPDVVTRLLDLVSSHFEYVVIDMPRTWFSWTDSVLLGSNRLYIVTEMTVPSLRQSKQLVLAIGERLGEGPKPQVIVNRFEQRMFEAGLRRTDIEQALGSAFIGTIPNNYRLVREAIDRGVPLDEVKSGNNISAALKKLIGPPVSQNQAASKLVSAMRSRGGFLWAR